MLTRVESVTRRFHSQPGCGCVYIIKTIGNILLCQSSEDSVPLLEGMRPRVSLTQPEEDREQLTGGPAQARNVISWRLMNTVCPTAEIMQLENGKRRDCKGSVVERTESVPRPLSRQVSGCQRTCPAAHCGR